MHNEHIRDWLKYRIRLYHQMIRAEAYYRETLAEYTRSMRVSRNGSSNVVNIKINSK